MKGFLMKKVKKFFKGVFIVCSITLILTLALVSVLYFKFTNGYSLDKNKLEQSSLSSNVTIFDINGKPINNGEKHYCKISSLSQNTINAFIAAEDKRFYAHHGIDYLGIVRAISKNIKLKSFKEGASTISQQLVKNTHLTNEKTISRKLRELKLTKQLEKSYSKNEILEMYLNNIYFGNGCYGIENASRHYFSKPASKLSLHESAALAATINAPSIYNLEKNNKKATERRNLILNLMQNQGKISKKEYENAKNNNIKLNLTPLSFNDFLLEKIIEEASNILKIDETKLKNSNLEIHTSINLNLENEIEKIIKSNFNNIQSKPEISTIVINNETGQIISATGNKNSLLLPKQPGSVIKPLLVYGPALELNLISPASLILDEKTNFNGYSPDNADKKSHGWVSVRESLKNSYNIPAVKILSEVGVENAKNFASKLKLNFEEDDNNLAMALGALSKGLTLSKIATAYSCIARNGKFIQPSLITKITSNNKTIYKNNFRSSQVISDSTAYMLTDMLKDCAKTGTAKRLNELPYEVASKTGTVGIKNSTDNSDCFNVAYTSNHTILTYFGGTIMPKNINGATLPTILTKQILNELYKNEKPQNFVIPNSITKIRLSKFDYKKNIVAQTNDNTDSFTEIFSVSNKPIQSETSLNKNLSVFNFSGRKPIFNFELNKNYDYKFHRISQNDNEIIYIPNIDKESKNAKFEDINTKNNEFYEYYLEIKSKTSPFSTESNHIKIKSF